VRGRDRGSLSYLDVQVTVDVDTTAPSVTCGNADTLWHASDIATGPPRTGRAPGRVGARRPAATLVGPRASDRALVGPRR